MNLGIAVNSPAPEFAPTLSRDGRYLFFARLLGSNTDIYISRRRNVHDDFAWDLPVALPAPVSVPSFDGGPDYFENPHGLPQLFFASDRSNGLGIPGTDIYVTELRRDGTWTTPTLVIEVSSAFQDNRPAVRADGLEMILTSTRNGNPDLYASHRNSVWEPWGMPELTTAYRAHATRTAAQ